MPGTKKNTPDTTHLSGTARDDSPPACWFVQMLRPDQDQRPNDLIDTATLKLLAPVICRFFTGAFQIENQARCTSPGQSARRARPWRRIRSSMPYCFSVTDQIFGQSGMLAAFGHSHYGMSNAPGFAKPLTSPIRDETPHIDASPYRVTRFRAVGTSIRSA